MGRKSQHNISRANIWENTFSNIMTKDTNPTNKELLYAVLAQETFGSEYIDDIFSKWDKIYSNVFNMLKDLRAKLMSNATLELPSIDFKQPLTIEQEKMIKAQNDVKYSLEKLPTYFNTLDENTIIVKFKDIIKFLGDNVGVSVTSVKDLEKNFEKNSIEKKLPTTLKDNLNSRVSDDVVLCNLALILAFAHNKSIPFNILNEELSEQLDNILIKNNTDLSTEGNKKINTDNFNLALDFLKKHITSYIPFSNEIQYQIIFTSYINATYKRIHKPLNECIKTLENIVTFLKNNINYTQNTKLLKEISTLFFDQEIEYKSLKTLCEKWTSYLNNLENCKKQVLVEYHSLLPKIAFEVLQSELQIIDNEISEIAHSVYNNLQCTNSDINKYYAFVSNIRTSNNFDHLWYIIESLVKMPDSISNNFIDIFMSKFNNEKTQSHVNINISLDDLKDLVNTKHLSGEHLEKLATIHFDELTDKKWNFLYCLPIIENENKEWFEDFFSMLKIYCK